MSPEVMRTVRVAIVGWPQTLRLCLIIVVLAVTTVICLQLTGIPALPFLMK